MCHLHSHWYRTLSPGERLRLEFATLLAQELYEPSSLAKTLGRFRENNALQEIGQILEKAGYIEYATDGYLYIHTPKNPISYLEKKDTILVVSEVQNLPTTKSAIKQAENQAFDAFENDEIVAHISGLLRPPIIQDAFRAVEEDGMQTAFAMFMSPKDYLTFLSETEFEPTTRFPLLRHGIFGEFEGIAVVVSERFGPSQIVVVADDGTTAVVNSD